MNSRLPIVDLSLGISAEAMMILHLLHETEEKVTVGNIHTAAWYNGRERGIVIGVREYESEDKSGLCLAFGRDRNSDSLFIDAWFQPFNLNPPSCHDAVDKRYYEESYKRHEFLPGAFNEVAQTISSFIKEFLTKRKGRAKAKKPKLRRIK